MLSNPKIPESFQPASITPLFFQKYGLKILFFFAILTGFWLRTTQLPGQMLLDDEWHALCSAARASYRQILTSFGGSDHSIPLVLYYKLLMDTAWLSECGIRFPFLLAGTLSIGALPLLVRRLVDRSSFVMFAWLLALSATLVFFSRFARPYSLSILLSFSAVIFFHRWWQDGKTRHAAAYLALASMAGYLTLVVLPFILAPFIFFFTLSLFERSGRKQRQLNRLITLGFLTAAALSFLLIPPLLGDLSAIRIKAGHKPVPLSILPETFRILIGASGHLHVAFFALLAAGGLLRMLISKNNRMFSIYLIALTVAQFSALWIIRPLASDSPHILARYMLPGLPAIFLFIAVGVQTVSNTLFLRHKVLQAAASVLCCLALFLSGPYYAFFHKPNNALSLTLYLHALTGGDHQWILRRVPAFYESLAYCPPGTLTLLEAPHQCYTDHIPLYQEIHRQHVLKGAINGLWCTIATTGEGDFLSPSKHLRFRTMIDLNDIQALFDRHVDFVIFHKHLQDETPVSLPGYRDVEISEYVNLYQKLFGLPIFEDQDIVVFSLNSPHAGSGLPDKQPCGDQRPPEAGHRLFPSPKI